MGCADYTATKPPSALSTFPLPYFRATRGVVRLGKRKLDVAVQETVCCENLYLVQSLQLDSQSNNQRPYPRLIPASAGEWQSAADAFERQHLGSDLIAKERKRGLFFKKYVINDLSEYKLP